MVQKNILLMMSMEEKLNPIKIRTWASWTVSGCLESRVGGNQVHLVTYSLISDRVCWYWNKTVVNWGLFPVGWKCEPWVNAPDIIFPSGYVRRRLLNKGIFHLWDCPEDVWMKMNE